jgi:hypothetical protein
MTNCDRSSLFRLDLILVLVQQCCDSHFILNILSNSHYNLNVHSLISGKMASLLHGASERPAPSQDIPYILRNHKVYLSCSQDVTKPGDHSISTDVCDAESKAFTAR